MINFPKEINSIILSYILSNENEERKNSNEIYNYVLLFHSKKERKEITKRVKITVYIETELQLIDECRKEYIGQLDWIEYKYSDDLINLKNLNLYNSRISDCFPLSGLINLTYLYLSYNQLTDCSPFSSLTNLTKLYLGDNRISNFLHFPV